MFKYNDLSYSNEIRDVFIAPKGVRNYKAITLGKRSYMGETDIMLYEEGNLIIGNYCAIATNGAFLIGANHDYSCVMTYPLKVVGINSNQVQAKNINPLQIIIGHDVWIGRNVTIMGGVKVGNGAVIGTNALVLKDVPPYAIVGGNPAKVIKYRFETEIIQKLNKIKWWYWDEKKITTHKEFMYGGIEDFVDAFYSLDMEKRQENQMSKALQELNKNGEVMRLYFIPDFDDLKPMWRKVIGEYINKFSFADQVVLILGFIEPEMHQAEIDEIQKMISDKGENAPSVLNIKEGMDINLAVIQNVDYFITTRAFKSLEYIDYGQDYGVKIVNGINSIVFDMQF